MHFCLIAFGNLECNLVRFCVGFFTMRCRVAYCRCKRGIRDLMRYSHWRKESVLKLEDGWKHRQL